MKKGIKINIKRICFVLLFLLALGVGSVCAYAYSMISMTWYSDAYKVGYWADSPKVFFTNLTSSFNISSYVNTGVSRWNSAGVTSSITTSYSNANILFYGGTRSQLNSYGFIYDSNTAGYTTWDSTTMMGYANNSSLLKVYRLNSTKASMCYEASGQYTHLGVHEYGHALGWYGHTGYSSDVMYGTANYVTVLSNRDKNQLVQVYNAMN